MSSKHLYEILTITILGESKMVEGLIYEIPKWLTGVLATLGGVVFIYLVIQIINFFLLRERKKILLVIREDLKRIEEKIDKLKKR